MMRYEIPQNVMYCTVDDDMILAQLDEGMYFRLNESGSWIWSRIAKGDARKDIAARLAVRYGIVESEAERDIKELTADLLENGLLDEAAPD